MGTRWNGTRTSLTATGDNGATQLVTHTCSDFYELRRRAEGSALGAVSRCPSHRSMCLESVYEHVKAVALRGKYASHTTQPTVVDTLVVKARKMEGLSLSLYWSCPSCPLRRYNH